MSKSRSREAEGQMGPFHSDLLDTYDPEPEHGFAGMLPVSPNIMPCSIIRGLHGISTIYDLFHLGVALMLLTQTIAIGDRFSFWYVWALSVALFSISGFIAVFSKITHIYRHNTGWPCLAIVDETAIGKISATSHRYGVPQHHQRPIARAPSCPKSASLDAERIRVRAGDFANRFSNLYWRVLSAVAILFAMATVVQRDRFNPPTDPQVWFAGTGDVLFTTTFGINDAAMFWSVSICFLFFTINFITEKIKLNAWAANRAPVMG